MAPRRHHVSGPKPGGGPTPSLIRTRAHLGAPLEERLRLRRRSRFLSWFALSVGVVSALHAAWYAMRPFDELRQLELIGLVVGAIGLLLSLPVARSRSGFGLFVLALFPLAEAVIFLLVFNGLAPPVPNRWLLVGAASLTLGLVVMSVGVVRPTLSYRGALGGGAAAALVAFAIEASAGRILAERPVGLPLDAAEPTAVLGFAEFVEEMDGIGPVPSAGSRTESRYLGNPRGYFREEVPEWVLWTQPSHTAELDVTSERTAVYIDQANDSSAWHIQLSRFGLAVTGGTDYVLRLRMRATSPRR